MPNIIHISNFSDPELDIYARYSENQLLNRDCPDKSLFIAESPKVIERALSAGYEPVSMLVEEKDLIGEAAELISKVDGIPIFTAPFEVLTQLTGFQLTRGVLCAMKRKKLPSIEEICCNARRVAILENIQNPTNVGAIIRSAAALNIDALLLTDDCSNPLYRRAVRVSMGTVFQIPWTIIDSNDYTWPEGGISKLKSMGFSTVSMALTNETVDIDNEELKSKEKLAVILGAEGYGLSDRTISLSDYTVKIPMTHNVDSLNVAAASAVAFWELGNK